MIERRISVDPNIHFGKPCVAGTRIPVRAVLELIGEGHSFDEINQDFYPDLHPEDIRACICLNRSDDQRRISMEMQE